MNRSRRFAICLLFCGLLWTTALDATALGQRPPQARRRGRLPNPQIAVLVEFLDPAVAQAYDRHRRPGRYRRHGRNRNPRQRNAPPHREDLTHVEGHFELIGGVWADATPGDGIVVPLLVFYVDTYGFPTGVENAMLKSFAAWDEVTAGALIAGIEFTYFDESSGILGDGLNTVSMWELPDGILAATYFIWDDADDDGSINDGEELLETDIVHNALVAWGTDEFRPITRHRASVSWYDLESVTTHELGQVFGLDHPGDAHRKDRYQTMYAIADPGETIKRTLELDGDIPGVQSELLGYGSPW